MFIFVRIFFFFLGFGETIIWFQRNVTVHTRFCINGIEPTNEKYERYDITTYTINYYSCFINKYWNKQLFSLRFAWSEDDCKNKRVDGIRVHNLMIGTKYVLLLCFALNKLKSNYWFVIIFIVDLIYCDGKTIRRRTLRYLWCQPCFDHTVDNEYEFFYSV